MNVEVTIEVSTPPIEKNLDNLKTAASKLTNNINSITVQVYEKGDRFFLVTSFTMRKAAQDKAVGDIDSEFEFWTFNLQGYQDSTISFPSKHRSSNKFGGDDHLSSKTRRLQ
jgi:murein L,D-transpeptidase YafK